MTIYPRDYIVFCMVAIVLLMNVANVIIESHNAIKGEELAKIQEEIKETKRINSLLNEQILKEASLPEIDKKAREAGFIELTDKQIFYVK